MGQFLARIGVEKDKTDPRDDGRNVIAAAIGPDHADYARLMGGVLPAAQAIHTYIHMYMARSLAELKETRACLCVLK